MIKRLLKLIEYTEEPDAFETQSEREMEAEMEKENDKLHLGQELLMRTIRKRLFDYISGLGFTRDVHMVGNKVQFYIPQDKLYWYSEWKENSKLIKQFGLKPYIYNMSNGYIVEV